MLLVVFIIKWLLVDVECKNFSFFINVGFFSMVFFLCLGIVESLMNFLILFLMNLNDLEKLFGFVESKIKGFIEFLVVFRCERKVVLKEFVLMRKLGFLYLILVNSYLVVKMVGNIMFYI